MCCCVWCDVLCVVLVCCFMFVAGVNVVVSDDYVDAVYVGVASVDVVIDVVCCC